MKTIILAPTTFSTTGKPVVAAPAAKPSTGRRVVTLLSACLALGASSATAAVVIWETPTVAVAPSDVANTGTFFAAIAVSVSVTLNGVTFDSYADGNNNTNPISLSGGGEFLQSSSSLASADYNTLLNAGLATQSDGGSYDITINGLTPGNFYRLQVWTPAWDNDFPTTFTAGNSVNMGNSANSPTWVIGYVQADVSGQQVFSYAATSPGPYGLIAAVAVFQVSAIPEPSVYATMTGLAIGGFAAWKRRRLTMAGTK